MHKQTIGYIVIIALLAITSFFSVQLYMTERSAHDSIEIKNFPMKMGEWTGTEIPVDEQSYQILQTRNLITREYRDNSGNALTLFIIYSEMDRSVFHPPEVCLIGSGFDITDKKPEVVKMSSREFVTNKLHMEKKDFKELVLYSYKAGNLYTDNFYLQQIYLALHQLFGKPVPGATIRVSMAIRGDEAKTLGVLKVFLVETSKIVDSMSIGKGKG